jgi:hypothetical protein
VGKAYGDTRIANSPTRAYVGANTVIIAGDDVAVTAASDHTVGATATSSGGGGSRMTCWQTAAPSVS